MFGKRLLALILIFSPVTLAKDLVTADELRRKAVQYDVNQQKKGVSPSDLKSMLGIIDGNDKVVYYRHQGITYPGIQLPDGTLAPAIINAQQIRKPGCLASDGKIYSASWNEDHLVCHLPKNDRALIPVDQRNAVLREPTKKSGQENRAHLSKYSRQAKKHSNSATSDVNINTLKNVVISSEKSVAVSSKVNRDPNRYIPPPRNNTSSQAKSYSVKTDTSQFGISFGTWASAEIKRSVTNADAGQVEIVLAETIFGRVRQLPAQTVLYGYKSFNSGTNRLDVQINKGITPEGQEIKLSATVYSEDKSLSGLAGVLLRDRKQELNHVAKNTVLQTASLALSSASPENPIVGTAYDSVTQQALNNERRYLKQQQGPIIKVFPQQVYLRIDRSF